MLVDKLNRRVRDLRISVTDRCNFRCVYCMPEDKFGGDYKFLPRTRLLTFEEICQVARCYSRLGVEKIRLTGGEPLLRKDLHLLVAQLAAIDGIRDISLTTNGVLLSEKQLVLLRDAGLMRVTVSLDAIEESLFSEVSGTAQSVQLVLDGIDRAIDAGFGPLKINMVVKRGMNEDSVLEMARYFRRKHCVLRFIEYMDVGNSNGWEMDDVVSGREIIAMINGEFPLRPIDRNYPGEVAMRWRYADGSGEIGVITSVTRPFCSDCTRARLSADGKLYTCLFASEGLDIRSVLRSGEGSKVLESAIAGQWQERLDRYSEIRTESTGHKKIEMSYIGG